MAAGVRDDLRRRTAEILRTLRGTYPDAHCELVHHGAYQLLVATVLSAQCTDKRVNMVTPAFFARFPDAASLAGAPQEEVEELIRTTGFFRSKAKNLRAAAAALIEHHGGLVPRTMEELTRLPGVGRKTANVVLGNACGIEEGVVVDTHVARLSQRLKLTRHRDPVKIERDLMRLVPRACWTLWSHLLIWHGRRRCTARKPDCAHCEILGLCPTGKKALKL